MNQWVPPYRLILEGLNHGRIIPFLGSGASLSNRNSRDKWNKDTTSFPPSANELATHLAKETEFPKDESLDLTKVAQYYNIVGGRELLRKELHNIFSRDYPLATIHSLLADISIPQLIVTSNYDDLIERAFTAKGRLYHTVIYTTDPTMGYRLIWWPPGESEPQQKIPNKLDINLETETVIYKVHGAVDRQVPGRDQYVITEDDYIDFLTRMTKNRAIPSIFSRAFSTRSFLFLGYSLRDWNLRVVISRIGKELHRSHEIKSWAIQHQPSFLEQRFWQERGVEVYDMKIDEFVGQLIQ